MTSRSGVSGRSLWSGRSSRSLISLISGLGKAYDSLVVVVKDGAGVTRYVRDTNITPGRVINTRRDRVQDESSRIVG